jgi:MerR family transcriptional regulator, heat shock protein HspR
MRLPLVISEVPPMSHLPEHDLHRPKYSITTVTELTGVHPQQLRRWEKAGILAPERSAKGTRRYSDADLQRIRQILELTETGINQAGVEHILRLQLELEQAESRANRAEAQLDQQRPHE